ncbi:hypothetical protein BGZ95_008064, partial [Linnemannia exigua]
NSEHYGVRYRRQYRDTSTNTHKHKHKHDSRTSKHTSKNINQSSTVASSKDYCPSHQYFIRYLYWNTTITSSLSFCYQTQPQVQALIQVGCLE